MKTTKIIIILAIFLIFTPVLEAKTYKNKAKKSHVNVFGKLTTKNTRHWANLAQSRVFTKQVIVKIKSGKDQAKTRILKARVTKYLATGNKTASGKWPRVGYVAVSDRSIPFGSIIYIDGNRFTVEDLTAKWVHTKSLRKGYAMTVDIFSQESYCQCLNFGAQTKKVALKKKIT